MIETKMVVKDKVLMGEGKRRSARNLVKHVSSEDQ